MLHRQVGPTNLCHRVVAVLEEDPLVEALGPAQVHQRILADQVGGDRGDAGFGIGDELVEEEPTDRLGATAVAGEQRSLDDFGQVDESEHRPVDIGEEAGEHRHLVAGEALLKGLHGGDRTGGNRARLAFRSTYLPAIIRYPCSS